AASGTWTRATWTPGRQPTTPARLRRRRATTPTRSDRPKSAASRRHRRRPPTATDRDSVFARESESGSTAAAGIRRRMVSSTNPPLLSRRVPALESLRHYTWADARVALVAGLSVAAVAVPQAMAYAMIAGLPAEYGLYTAVVMTTVGALFDSSRQLIN